MRNFSKLTFLSFLYPSVLVWWVRYDIYLEIVTVGTADAPTTHTSTEGYALFRLNPENVHLEVEKHEEFIYFSF